MYSNNRCSVLVTTVIPYITKMEDMMSLIIDNLKCNRLEVAGSKYISTVVKSLSEIYVPKGVDQKTVNKARKSTKLDHINMLVNSLGNGIDYTKQPPIIKKVEEQTIVDGVEYQYVLVAGFHRFRALEKLGKTEWVFDIYEMGTSNIPTILAQSTLQIQENDHSPELANTQDDIINIVSYLIKQKLIKNTEKAITDYLMENCTNMHKSTMAKCIKGIVRANGTYVDFATYEADQIAEINDKQTEGYVTGGNLDNSRDMFGITVLEDYENPLLTKTVLNYSKFKKETYFLMHTKLPSEKRSLGKRRRDMVQRVKDFESGLVKVVDFYNKHGRFPWSIEAFIGQDKREGKIEDIYLDVDKACKHK